MGDSRTEYFIYWRPSGQKKQGKGKITQPYRKLASSCVYLTPINTIKQLIIMIIKCYGAASIKTLFMGQHLINPFFFCNLCRRYNEDAHQTTCWTVLSW